MQKLIGEGKSIIFISHKMREVLHISDRITVLRLGEVVGTVARADTDGQKLANMMIGKELTESQYEKVDASGAEVVASLDHVDYDKEHKHSGVNDMTLQIRSGEIVGIAGVDGNGQTQLAQLITGVIVPQGGKIYLKDRSVAVFDPILSLQTAFPTFLRTATRRAWWAICPLRRIWCSRRPILPSSARVRGCG